MARVKPRQDLIVTYQKWSVWSYLEVEHEAQGNTRVRREKGEMF